METTSPPGERVETVRATGAGLLAAGRSVVAGAPDAASVGGIADGTDADCGIAAGCGCVGEAGSAFAGFGAG
ncbi:MAG: hypothetical protein HY056_01500 [Proteobacteria bacterium]|nr:hypothetical protein [Pseudomonadota bacterium]